MAGTREGTQFGIYIACRKHSRGKPAVSLLLGKKIALLQNKGSELAA